MRLNREGEKSLKRGLFAPTNERIFRESVSRRCESYCRENLGTTIVHILSNRAGFAAQPSCEGFSHFEFKDVEGEKMSHPLKQKVALVTGGSRGIGAAIAKRLAADGASLAITYSKGADAATSVVSAIEQAGGKAIAIQADAADAEAVKDAVEKTVAAFGGIDVLVNNAGTAIPKKFEETTLEEIDRMFAINVRGTMAATQAALKHMKSGGRIIMIGSCVGERTLTPGLVAYSATKGAVKMFTQGLTREVGGRGITVNNVQPGPIDTDLNPAAGDWAAPQKAVTALDRYGHVDEVAALVAFVAGPESSYITGANLTVDGGTNA
jgi:3-oxoacyl-[acyl-carrier protein] reductase